MSMIQKWYEQANDFIWNRSTDGVPRWQSRTGKVLRFVYVIMRDLAAGQLNLRAMSLVYTTLLSLVPL
ncbi:MAG: ribonuclease BN, partial [Proteobacteria bacterium]|nr:ribonuclease BN [Pseudomonadota bacterium]